MKVSLNYRDEYGNPWRSGVGGPSRIVQFPEPCLSCGGHFPDEQCAVDNCDTRLHRYCGTACCACGRIACSIHTEVIDDLDVCAECAPAVRAMNAGEEA
jgi:hypothetical protein